MIADCVMFGSRPKCPNFVPVDGRVVAGDLMEVPVRRRLSMAQGRTVDQPSIMKYSLAINI